MINLRWIGVLLLTLLCSGGIRAQEVIYSPYERFDIRSGDFSVIGKIGDRIYTYRGGNDGFFLDAYNDSMEKMATVLLDFFPKKIYETRFVNYPDKLLVLYQAIESNKVVQYAALLDQTGRLLKGPIQLTSEKTGIFGASGDYFSSAVSDDKKHILVYGIEESRNQLQLTGVWVDDQLADIKRGGATFKTDNSLTHREGILDNNGNFFLPAYTPTGTRNFADQLWLLSLTRGGRRFYSKELPLNDLFATSTYMKLDNTNGRIYAGGFYSDKKNGNYEGVIYAYYDLNDSSWHNRKTIAFNEPLRNATGERNKRRAFNNYQVKQMVIKKDGGFVLIAEDFFVTTNSRMGAYGMPGSPYWGSYYGQYGMGMPQQVREYNYDDILTLSYDANGTSEWNAFVRKSQYSQEDGGMFSSYGLINTGGSLGFLFNDFNTRNSRIQLATISADGKVNMQSLAQGTAADPDWLPRSGKQIGIREVIVPCLRKRQICFAKIIF